MSAMFLYHFAMVMKKKKPEEAFGVNEPFLNMAYFCKYGYEDLVELLTKPPVKSLLLPRPPMPPGYTPMKTLVLNVSGTLVHGEYKLGVGFEILKRPGLSIFLQRLSRQYELVLFGD